MHYLPVSETELGPVPTHLFLRKAVGQILAEHVVELASKEGNPIRTVENPIVLGNRYKAAYRRIRPLRDILVGNRDDRTILIENYSLLNQLYRYRPTPFTRIHKFTNTIRTLVEQINRIASLTQREQFIELRLPQVIPGRPQFVAASKNLTRTTMTFFPNDDALLLLELWKWLGKDRHTSLFAQLTPEAIKRLNFVVVENASYTVFNLGRVDGWRKTQLEDGSYTAGIMPEQLQLRFAKFLEALYVIRTVGAKTIIEQQEVADSEDGELETTAIVREGRELEEIRQMELEAEEIKDIPDAIIPVLPVDEPAEVEPPQDSVEQKFTAPMLAITQDMRASGVMSSAEERRMLNLATSYTRIPNPRGPGTLEDLLNIDPEVINAPLTYSVEDIPLVVDKSMLQTTLNDFDPNYIDKVLHADIANMLMQSQLVGVAITGYQIDRVTDAGNDYEIHTVRLTPAVGTPSTFRFRIPVINPDGTFVANGVKLRIRKQRSDVPIRKVSPTRVALTTYYSKLFVNRSERKVDDYGTWFGNQLMVIINTTDRIKDVAYGRVFKHTEIQPKHYSILATRFRGFEVGDYQFRFDVDYWRKSLGDEVVNEHQKVGELPCGYMRDGLVVMTEAGAVYVKGESATTTTSIEEILGIDYSKAPVDVVDLTFMGKNIPMGVVLGYFYGISKLLQMLKPHYRVISRGSKADMQPDEFAVKFSDVALIFSRHDRLASLLFSGFAAYEKSVSMYALDEFNRPDVYGTVLDRQGLGGRYVRELDNMRALFIDHISKEILESMSEPTEFAPLLLRATQLLLNDYHPEEIDGKYRREKGYERIAGHVYTHLVRGLRQYRARPVTARAQVDISPNAVWTEIQQDPSVAIVEESNPIHNCKETENLTFGGTGGRSSRSLVRSTRAFHPNDLGVVSEATVDSSDVAVTTFLSANPRISNLRGMHEEGQADLTDVTRILSTSSLISPASTRDDPKRANFISIQQSHVVAAVGYEPCPLRTGYEQVLAHRVNGTFAVTASGPGVVESITEDAIVIAYDDPDEPKLRAELGRYYGVVTGTTVPHDIITDLSVGQRVSKDHVICWNSGFFDRDLLQPTQVVWKAGVPVRTVLMETSDTLEDSCAVSTRLSSKLQMNTTEVRVLTVNFKQEIRNLVTTGQQVEADSILCNIIDTLSSGEGSMDPEVIDTLSALARTSPRAKTDGIVGRIEVLYNGDLEDMTPTLREIAMAADRYRAKRSRVLKRGVLTGQMRDLEIDTMVIKVFIDAPLGAADGDKAVFGNQMKTVIGRVFTGKHETLSGLPIDAIFSYSSPNNRIVRSPDIIGTTCVLLRLATERAVRKYRGN